MSQLQRPFWQRLLGTDRARVLVPAMLLAIGSLAALVGIAMES